jgi:hypothetical protein
MLAGVRSLLLRSARATLAIVFVAIAGESSAWHRHPLDEPELRARNTTVIEHTDGCGPAAHLDHAHDTVRPACLACILASSPLAAAGPPRRLALTVEVVAADRREIEFAPEDPRLRPAGGRAPPASSALFG